MVTTTDATAPSSDRIGVELTRVLTRRPSGTDSTISSARTVSAAAEMVCQRELAERDLAAVGAPAGHDLLQLFQRPAGGCAGAP